MAHPGLDPETALKLILTLLHWLAYMFAAFALVGLSIYIVFLCLEIFSPQPRSKARRAKVPHRAGCAPVAEENPDLLAAETPILAEAESLSREAVPALPHDARPVTPKSEAIGP